MKKRILSLVMIMPFIVMLLAFGFSRTVNLFVDLQPEFLVCDYEDEEAFEYSAAAWESGVELVANVHPANASSTDIIWTLDEEFAFDGMPCGDAENPVAKIENGRLYKYRDGVVILTAAVEGTSLSRTFRAYLIEDDGSGSKEPKFVILRGSDTAENSIKSQQYRYFGLYDRAGDAKVLHTETFTARVYPTSAPQDIEYSILNADGAAEVTVTGDGGENKIEIAFSAPTENFCILRVNARGTAAEATAYFRIIDGVNVYSYDDLMFCTAKDPSSPANGERTETVVLRKNLESRENLRFHKNSALFGREVNGKVTCDYSTMTSTYDIREYTNPENDDKRTAADAVINVGVTFRKSVYGNGYTINAHELTYPSGKIENYDTEIASLTDADVFRGPLDFVKAYNCRCFGQDNAGFMFQRERDENGQKDYEFVVDCLTLKNCNNVSNLSNLDYVGTVAEIDGDDITLQYSQIMNGRVVVRSMSNKNLKIDACMLSYAREFILKAGSNKFVYAENIPASVNLTNKSEAYPFLSPDEDGEGPLAGRYDSTVTVKNTYFHTSGIFCIGMDAHFAGRFLYNFPNDPHVHDMAATSYPSKVSLEGDVRFYDWKTVDGLDSTSLIDLGVSDAGRDYSDLFDISSVIENYYESNPESNMILVIDGKHYVHGGVAFYGGGRNLSKVDFGKLNDEQKALFSDTTKPFTISLDDASLGLSLILTGAAGYGPFQFYMYDPSETEITFGSMPKVSDLGIYVSF